MDIEEPAAEPQQQPAAATAAGLSEQEAKRQRKLEQNRLAAQLSRQRKKQRTEELQKHIIEVSFLGGCVCCLVWRWRDSWLRFGPTWSNLACC
jgi:hypothetical protein